MAKNEPVNRQDVYEDQMKTMKGSKVMKTHEYLSAQTSVQMPALNYSLEMKQWVRLPSSSLALTNSQ